MKPLYCANCGATLKALLKAMPKFSTIITVIFPHECGDIIEPDLTENPAPTYVPSEEKKKFIQKLDELQPPSPFNPLGEELRDRRDPAFVKGNIVSTAPIDLIRQMRDLPMEEEDNG